MGKKKEKKGKRREKKENVNMLADRCYPISIACCFDNLDCCAERNAMWPGYMRGMYELICIAGCVRDTGGGGINCTQTSMSQTHVTHTHTPPSISYRIKNPPHITALVALFSLLSRNRGSGTHTHAPLPFQTPKLAVRD